MKLGTKVLSRIILMAAVATAVFGFTFASAEDYGIYVAGTQITSENASDVLGDGTVSYDAATSTITLKDANIEYDGCGIDSEYVDIIVTGTATFATYSSSIYSYDANLTIKDATITCESEDYYTIYADEGSIVIDNSTVDATASSEWYDAIWAECDENGSLTIKNSKISVNAGDDGLFSDYDMTIENSEITIEAGTDGIYAATVSIVDSNVIINGGDGIYLWSSDGDSDIVIKGSKVSIFSRWEAIYASNFEVTDSIINCESEDVGIYADKMVFNSGYIHVSSVNYYAFYAEDEMVFEKPYGIYSPSDAKILKQGDDSHSFYVIVPADVEEYQEEYNSETGLWSDNACKDVIITAEFTVTWADADGNAIATDKYIYGQTPEFKGTVPTKAEDDKYTYEFAGWDKEISEVTGDVTYKAVFKAIEKAAAIDKPADKPKDVAPKTGDAENVLVLMGIAILAMAGAVVARRRA